MFSILQRKSLCSISKLVLSFYISRQENGKNRFYLKKNTISVLLVELKGFDGLGQFFAVFIFFKINLIFLVNNSLLVKKIMMF